MKKIISLIILAAAMLGLSSCTPAGSKIVGSWEATTLEMTAGGTTITTDLSKTEMSIFFAFYENGKGSLSIRNTGESDTEHFEYSYAETILSITVGGETEAVTASIIGNLMVLDFTPFLDDTGVTKATLTLKKVS